MVCLKYIAQERFIFNTLEPCSVIFLGEYCYTLNNLYTAILIKVVFPKA